MAYDRTERFRKLVTQTPANVGPASYEIVDLQSKPPRDPDCLYPFLCGAKRSTLKVSRDTANFPGPGSYCPIEPRHHVPGGVSIDYTEARFKRGNHDDSGPADFKDEFVDGRYDRKTQKRFRGKLWLCRPPRSSATTGVSVPSRRDANGYDVNEYGILVKNPPDEREPTPFYDIPRQEANFTTVRYKGNFWSRMTGREEDGRDPEMPGPGYYEHEVELSLRKMENEKLREHRRATSKQPRYLEALYERKLREGNPAPNQYDLPRGPFDGKLDLLEERKTYVGEPPAFGRSGKRFENVYSEQNPGPGVYDIVGMGKSRPGSVLRAPFGSCMSRFKRTIIDSAPEPGRYYTGREGLAYESWKRYKRNVVIGSSKPVTAKVEEEEMWTPSYSCPEVNSFVQVETGKKCRVYHAVFKSKTARTMGVVAKDNNTPGPNAYDIRTDYEIRRDPRNFFGRPRTAPFNSRTVRFPRVPEGVDMDVPGTGLYDIRLDISKDVKGGAMARACEIETRIPTGPGPQKYCLHPHVASSVLRRTFNVTLGRSSTLQAPKKQEITLTRRLRMKKTLRWFGTPFGKYEHC